MFLPFVFCLALPLLVFAGSLSQTTITPDADDLVAGSWTISVALPSPTTLEVLIETLFDQFNSVTLVGPTTFTSLVRDRPADKTSATKESDASTTNSTPTSPGTDGDPTVSRAVIAPTSNSAVSKKENGGSKAASSSFSPSSTLSALPPVGSQNQGPYGMDPDSAMAIEYDKAYANVSYKPPAYVPIKIAPEVCVLWDPKCQGNKTLAAEEFFGQGKANSSGTMTDLLLDPCFNDEGTDAVGTNCTSSLLDPASASFSSAVKSYMREPQCSKDYESIQPVSSRLWEDCCGTCYIYGPNVDVYYWPDPKADTSCLSIIGSGVIPLDVGAQTDAAGVVYWAASTNLYDIYVPTVTTAIITTINGVVVKEAVANPWDVSPSITTTRPVTKLKKRNHLSIHPRAFSPLYAREPTGGNSSSGAEGITSAGASEITNSIAVSNGFTFTSPSVYVAFYSLSATDMCGSRGNSISSTMLAFAPGELSTVQGHLWGGGSQNQKTKVFNFADLPCPPYDVMYDDWYKPAPGEPYRPLIALPEKVRDLDPWWNACTDAFYFTGLDPPRALQKEVAMITPAGPAANHGPTTTPDPVQPIPTLPVKTDTGDPPKVSVDPSEHKNVSPPIQAAPSSSRGSSDPPIIAGVPPTPTVNGLDPQQASASKASENPPTPTIQGLDLQQGAASKSPVDPSTVDPETKGNANLPATPQHSTGDPSQGTDPKTPDPKSKDVSVENPAASPTAHLQSGYGQHEADPNTIPSEQGSQVNNALGPAQSSAASTNPRPAPVNSNAQIQSGPGNVNPVPQPATTNEAPLRSGEADAGTHTSPLNAPKPLSTSSKESLVLKVPGVLPLTQAPETPSAYLVAGSTLLPGSPAVTISGTSYSLASSGSLIVGTSTIPLATAGGVAGQIAAPGALSAGNVAFTPLPGGSAIVGTSTLTVSGFAITSSGSVLSLAPGGLVVGSSTYAFATPVYQPVAPSTTTQTVPITTALHVAGHSFTANPSQFSINGTTISAGGPGVTLNGTPVSLDRSGNLAVGTSTVALESTSLGAATTSVVAFEGLAALSQRPPCWIIMAAVLGTWALYRLL